MNDPDDTDLLAAEYVLGTSDAVERVAVAARLEAGDADLRRAIAAWEDRLAPLAEALPGLVPPAAVYDGIMARLFGERDARLAAPDSAVMSLRWRLRRWQASTGAAALLAASLAVWIGVRESGPSPDQPRFVAVLQRDAGAPAILLDVDLSTRRLTIRPLGAMPPAGHSYELWIIDPALGGPRSLGVLSAGAGQGGKLTAFDPAVIENAVYAVTVEPPGGSPTGRPSAAPIMTGKLVPSSS